MTNHIAATATRNTAATQMSHIGAPPYSRSSHGSCPIS